MSSEYVKSVPAILKCENLRDNDVVIQSYTNKSCNAGVQLFAISFYTSDGEGKFDARWKVAATLLENVPLAWLPYDYIIMIQKNNDHM